jgi:hypothetical protein
MAVDMAHSAFEVDMVFFRPAVPRPATEVTTHKAAIGFFAATAPKTRVRWYFCPPNAKPLPFPTIFASTDWSDIYELAEQDIGEVPRAGNARWSNGATPIGATGQHYCGQASDFQVPKVWNPDAAVLPRGPSGLPLCCVPTLAAAVAFCGRRRAIGAIGLAGKPSIPIPPVPASGALTLTGSGVSAFLALTGQMSAGVIELDAGKAIAFGVIALTGAISSGLIGLTAGLQSSAGAMDLAAASSSSGAIDLAAASSSAGVIDLTGAISSGLIGLTAGLQSSVGAMDLAATSSSSGAIYLAAASSSAGAIYLAAATSSSGTITLATPFLPEPPNPAIGTIVLATPIVPQPPVVIGGSLILDGFDVAMAAIVVTTAQIGASSAIGLGVPASVPTSYLDIIGTEQGPLTTIVIASGGLIPTNQGVQLRSPLGLVSIGSGTSGGLAVGSFTFHDITMPDGIMVLMLAGYGGTQVGNFWTAVWNGINMSLNGNGPASWVSFPAVDSGFLWSFYAQVTSGTGDLVLTNTATPIPETAALLAKWMSVVHGVTEFADGISNGLASTPSIGQSGTNVFSPTIVVTGVMMKNAGGVWSWSGGTGDGNDVTEMFLLDQVVLTAGFGDFPIGGGSSFMISLLGITPDKWCQAFIAFQ